MELEISGNTALVTASSSGLGKASATELAREGVNVVINGRDKGRLEKAAKEIREVATGTVVTQQGDLTTKEDVEQLVNRTVEEFGTIDHLVLSAGGPPSGPFLETTDEEWLDAYDLLVMSVVRTVRMAAPHLRDGETTGTIVTITSRSVKEAIDSLVLSNAVRMSVIGLEKTISKELAPDVRANAVLPGPHETARIRELIEQGVERGEYSSYEDGLTERGKGNPRGQIGEPKKFGKTVTFLCSPCSDHINGTALPIDGGAGSSNL